MKGVRNGKTSWKERGKWKNAPKVNKPHSPRRTETRELEMHSLVTGVVQVNYNMVAHRHRNSEFVQRGIVCNKTKA